MSEAHTQRIARFTRIYDHFAKLLMGDDVTAKVDFAGKAIEPSLECDGPRDSTALKLAKWLAFDLGSMALSIAGGGHHPRFLLHDSPREADITEAIYNELFRAAIALEKAAIGEPPFQYIVTTTQPPPEELKCEPWLLQPVLKSWHDDAIVELFRRVGFVLVLLFPALPARELFALLHELPSDEPGARGSDLGLDNIDFVTHVDTIGDGFLVAVVADDVVLEEAVGAIVRRGSETDEEGVEGFFYC